MDTMTLLHELDGRAFTLGAARRPRRLFVLQGRAWITQQLPAPRRLSTLSMAAPPPAALPPDWWLVPGAVMELPAGSRWIVQAQGDLRLALREAAPAAPRRKALSRWWRALAALGWPGLRAPASASPGLAQAR